MNNKLLSIALVSDFVRTHSPQPFHIRMKGNSMLPTLHDGEMLTLCSTSKSPLNEGDMVLAQTDDGLRVYRIVLRRGDFFLLKGDAMKTPAPPVEIQQILGKVVAHQPYPRMRRLWDGVKNFLTGWLSVQICEMILENQSREG